MVDGASYRQRVTRVILPLTLRTVLLVTLVSVIGSLLAFDQFYIMTAGQPQNETATSVFYVYLNSFPYLKLGYGAALSLVLALTILAFTVVPVAAHPPEPLVSATHGAGRGPGRSPCGRGSAAGGYLLGAVCVVDLHGDAPAAACFSVLALGQADRRGGRRRRRPTSRTR